MKSKLKILIIILIVILVIGLVCILSFAGVENKPSPNSDNQNNNNRDNINDVVEIEEFPVLNPDEEYRIENESTDTILIEGMEEKIKVKTYISNFNYILKFDYETFKVERIDGKDKFTMISNPEVYVLIEPTTKAECKPDDDINVYKGNGDAYVKITKIYPEGYEYTEGVDTRIEHMIKTIRFE